MRKRVCSFLLILTAAALPAISQTLVELAVPSISGAKFEDANGNGVWDPTEPGLAGWLIVLTDASGASALAQTDAAGKYLFSPVAAGSYTVAESPRPGWARTFPGGTGTHVLLLPAGASAIDVNFGNRRACTPPPSQMTAWWPFDETGGGQARDIAGTIDSIGAHVGSPLSVTGMVDNALSFNGTSQYVQVPDGPDSEFGTGDLSIDAWVRTTAAGTRTILDKRVQTSTGIFGYAFFTVDGRLGFQMADRNGSGTCSNASTAACTNFIAPSTAARVTAPGWHHVAVTVDRDQPNGGTLYVDGTVVLQFDPTLRPQSLDNDVALLIARHALNGTDHWNGDIDEVELFRRALTQAEVQAISSSREGGKCKGWCGAPSLIQSDIGTRGNFEVVVPYPGGGIAHYYRDNDDPLQTWHLTKIFGQSEGIVSAVSMIQSRSGNFEVVARIGDSLAHFYRDNSTILQTWYGPFYFASGVAGSPSLIQSDYYANGNFEVVAPLASGGIQHYWRDNDALGPTWYAQATFGVSEGIVDDVSMIQSKPLSGANGDFDVAARIGDRLVYFRRSNPAQTWLGPDPIATGISGAPSLIQSSFGGNFEVTAPLASGGIAHYFRDQTFLPAWHYTTTFGSGSACGVSLIQSNYGSNFEVVANLGGTLEHYWRDTPFFAWHGPNHVAP